MVGAPEMRIDRPIGSSDCIPRWCLVILLWSGRRLGQCCKQPDFPMPVLADVNCSPKDDIFNWRPTLVFPGDTRLSHGIAVSGSQRPNLIHRYFMVIEPGFEYTLDRLFDIRVWPGCIDQHAITCEECSNPCSILLIEAFNVCGGDFFYLLLKGRVRSRGKPG
jgi:hypothetical protein